MKKESAEVFTNLPNVPPAKGGRQKKRGKEKGRTRKKLEDSTGVTNGVN